MLFEENATVLYCILYSAGTMINLQRLKMFVVVVDAWDYIVFLCGYLMWLRNIYFNVVCLMLSI